MAFRMKGHTLPGINQRIEGKNKADGRAKSSAFQKTLKEVTVSGGDAPERGADKFKRVKAESDAMKTNAEQAANISKNYGGTWTKKDGKWWINEKGQNVKEAAISQSKQKNRDKAEYIAANKTKNSGAPMKASPVTKKEFPKGTVDVSKRNVSTSKKKASKPKVHLDHEKIKTEYIEKKKNEQSKKENKSTNTKPKKKVEKRDMKVVNPTLVKGVDY